MDAPWGYGERGCARDRARTYVRALYDRYIILTLLRIAAGAPLSATGSSPLGLSWDSPTFCNAERDFSTCKYLRSAWGLVYDSRQPASACALADSALKFNGDGRAVPLRFVHLPRFV